MNTTTEPVTEQQLAFLQQHGHTQDRPLTRLEAAYLIRQIRTASGMPHDGNPSGAYRLGLAFDLKKDHELSAAASAESTLMAKRHEFWMDTCREITQMRTGSPQVMDLYRMHGCRFSLPSNEAVQVVLTALDAAVPAWETLHPELFYQTLELNFPELRKSATLPGS